MFLPMILPEVSSVLGHVLYVFEFNFIYNLIVNWISCIR